ncbi:MAG: 2-C-methyl-D-erythritol 4-phosphate cytidylyltransferase [Sphingobacteriaceae bacterium]
MKRYAIVVGGGSGSRMQQDIPKQFLVLGGKPVLMHTLAAFHQLNPPPELLVVLNVDYHEYWEKLCKTYQFTIPHTLVKAGQERFFSVKNGLKLVKGKALVAIHDAVRPLVSTNLISQSFEQAEIHGNAVTGVPCKDSIRQLTDNGSVALNRESIYLMQTPQTFKSELLQKAYQQDYQIEFTDDATVVERLGTPIHILPGESENIKITYPEDLLLAEKLLQQRAN